MLWAIGVAEMDDLRCRDVLEALEGTPLKIINHDKGYALIGKHETSSITYFTSPSLTEIGNLAYRMAR